MNVYRTGAPTPRRSGALRSGYVAVGLALLLCASSVAGSSATPAAVSSPGSAHPGGSLAPFGEQRGPFPAGRGVTGAYGATPTLGAAAVPPLHVSIAPLNASWVIDQNFSFKAYASGGTGGNYSYTWEFGDGANGSGWWVGHAYASVGSFHVSLTVTDPLHDTASASTTIAIYNVTHVELGIKVAQSTVAPDQSFTVYITPVPQCIVHTPPNCTVKPISLTLNLRVNNSSGSPWASYDVNNLTPGVNGSFSFPAPPIAGPWTVYVLLDHPWFTGYQFLYLTVEPAVTPPPPPTDLAPYALLAFGGAILLALAVGAFLTGRKRWARPER